MQNGGGEGAPAPDNTASVDEEEEDTIIVDAPPPGHTDYPSDDDMADGDADLPAPTFNDKTMSEQKKLDAVKRWSTDREKHEKKKRTKTSFVSDLESHR